MVLARRLLSILWASPWSLLGLLLGGLALITGGYVQRGAGALEFWGPGAEWFLRTFPLVPGAAALTLGHVVIGRTLDDLNRCRLHELVHVEQYERWGPAFVPAYLGWWVWLWLKGRNPYLDNPFEREAFRRSGSP